MPTLPVSYEYDGAARAWHREFPTLDLAHFLLGALVVRIGRMVEDDLSAQCQTRFGISGADMALLFALRRLGAPYSARPRDLLRMLLITSGAVTKQIDRLAAAGWVDRAPDSGSRNGQIVALTSAGLSLVDEAATLFARHAIIDDAMQEIDPALQRAGADFCHELVVALEAAAAKRARRDRAEAVRKRRAAAAPQ